VRAGAQVWPWRMGAAPCGAAAGWSRRHAAPARGRTAGRGRGEARQPTSCSMHASHGSGARARGGRRCTTASHGDGGGLQAEGEKRLGFGIV
jgi:hypothetical protein